MKERKSEALFGKEYPEERKDIEKLLATIKKRPAEDRERLLKTLRRYESEGQNDAYRSDTRGLAEFVRQRKMLNGSRSLVDLGAGSGDLIANLALEYPEKRFLGFDLSPSFVRKFNGTAAGNARMRVGLIDSEETLERLNGIKKGGVVSVLTLDRVADPLQLIKNMSEFVGAKILATLLPVTPIDDNPSIVAAGNPIEYTRKEMRVTPGVDANEDKQALLTLLNRIWGKGVRVDAVPYAVESSGDVQPYTLAVFSKD